MYGWRGWQGEGDNEWETVLRAPTMDDYPAGELSTEDLPQSGGIIGGLAKILGLQPALNAASGIPQKPTWAQDILPDVLGNIDWPAKEATSALGAIPGIVRFGKYIKPDRLGNYEGVISRLDNLKSEVFIPQINPLVIKTKTTPPSDVLDTLYMPENALGAYKPLSHIERNKIGDIILSPSDKKQDFVLPHEHHHYMTEQLSGHPNDVLSGPGRRGTPDWAYGDLLKRVENPRDFFWRDPDTWRIEFDRRYKLGDEVRKRVEDWENILLGDDEAARQAVDSFGQQYYPNASRSELGQEIMAYSFAPGLSKMGKAFPSEIGDLIGQRISQDPILEYINRRTKDMLYPKRSNRAWDVPEDWAYWQD